MYRCVLAMVVVLVFAGSSAYADVIEWQWVFKNQATCGVALEAVDDLDPLDLPLVEPRIGHVAVFHEQGSDGWSGPTGFYTNDMRAPLEMVPGNTKTWRMYFWHDPAYPPEYTETTFTWSPGQMPQYALETISFRVTYVRTADGVVDDLGQVGTSVVLNDWPDGGSCWLLPVYRTDNGLDGYIFDLTATVIPEPGGLLALAGGLGALILRRRR